MLFVRSSQLRGDLRLPLFYSLIVLLLYPRHCLGERFTVTGPPHQLAPLLKRCQAEKAAVLISRRVTDPQGEGGRSDAEQS